MLVNSSIHFFTQYSNYNIPNKKKLKAWLSYIIKTEKGSLNYLNYIFTSDKYLLELNQKYLNHNTYTDIITFPYNSDNEPIMSDIYISIERASDNAKKLNIKKIDEVHRLLVHGLLHLLSYNDHSESEKAEMRKTEDKYLSLRPNFEL